MKSCSNSTNNLKKALKCGKRIDNMNRSPELEFWKSWYWLSIWNQNVSILSKFFEIVCTITTTFHKKTIGWNTYSESPCKSGFKNALTSTGLIFLAKKFCMELCDIVIDYMSLQWLIYIFLSRRPSCPEVSSWPPIFLISGELKELD